MGGVVVKSVESAEKNPREVNNWIASISELHRSKPPPTVHFKTKMPDIERLMQVWPPDVEEALAAVCTPPPLCADVGKVQLPPAALDVDTAAYARIVCALCDIPWGGGGGDLTC